MRVHINTLSAPPGVVFRLPGSRVLRMLLTPYTIGRVWLASDVSEAWYMCRELVDRRFHA